MQCTGTTEHDDDASQPISSSSSSSITRPLHHPTASNDDDHQHASTSLSPTGCDASCRGRRARRCCTVAGCETAKLVLRVIEEQEKGELAHDALPHGSALEAACHFVRAVLRHRATCPWALGGASSADEPPCLLCALVSRARATSNFDHLALSFSSRAKRDMPSFSVPPATTLRRRDAPSPPPPLVDCPPELRRSNTTEELALLLSDLSRRSGSVAAASLTSANTYAREPASAAVAHQSVSSRHKANDDDESALPLPFGGLRRRPAPQLQCNESTEDEDAADQSSLSPFREYRRRELVDVPEPMTKRARIAHRSPRADDGQKPSLRIATSSPRAVPPPRAAILPRSPSFSAAASSLLALTGSKPRAPGQPRTGPMVSDTHAPPLLVPQC